MEAIINIKADAEIKKNAQKIASDLGLSLSAVINAYLCQLVRSKEIHFAIESELKPSVKRRLDHLRKDVKEGKNLSPAFYSAEEMDTYLNSLDK